MSCETELLSADGRKEGQKNRHDEVSTCLSKIRNAPKLKFIGSIFQAVN